MKRLLHEMELKILDALCEGSMKYSDLLKKVYGKEYGRKSPSPFAYHLKKLMELGLVTVKRNKYAITRAGIRLLSIYDETEEKIQNKIIINQLKKIKHQIEQLIEMLDGGMKADGR